MYASKLTISKEIQEKQKKSMSVRQRGRLMFAKLQELDADGTLSKAQTRADVAKLVGYSEERAKAGYSWVSNLVSRGYLSETVREWTPNGKMIAEYHTTGTIPSYGCEEAVRRKAKKAKIASEWATWQNKETNKQTEQWIEPPVIERATIDKPIKIGITRGDMSINVEIDNYEQASKLIATILKGE